MRPGRAVGPDQGGAQGGIHGYVEKPLPGFDLDGPDVAPRTGRHLSTATLAQGPASETKGFQVHIIDAD
jgi:hypothetical protein